ncbi:hypothetical protein LPJ56_005162, partial [Coemansia sp. RSA 2599]
MNRNDHQLIDQDDGFTLDSPFDTSETQTTKRPDLSGSIGGRMGSSAPPAGTSGGLAMGPQTAYTSNSLPGGYHTNTLDEPILTTIARDFGKVGRKTLQV